MKTRRIFLIGSVVAIVMTQSAHAASVTWNVAGGGTWDTSTGNWSGGSPTANLYANGDTANFTNTAGGTINLSGTIAPAATNVSAASGTYTFTGTGITSGTLTKTGAGTLIIGSSNSYSGITDVLSGTLTIASGGSIAPTTGAQLTIGSNTSSNGPATFNYDSALTSKFGTIRVGNGNDGAGNSKLNQTAGTINASGLVLNNGYTGQGAGEVNLSGTAVLAVSGTTTVSNTTFGDNVYSTITVGTGTSFSSGSINMTGNPSASRYGAGRITQNGGTVTTGTLNMARTTASNSAARRGEYNLNGGTLTVSNITQDAGSDTFGTFNFNGGTLKPTADTTTFMQGLTTASVKDGGAKIDTDGKNITIGQSLLHFAGSTTDSLTKSGAGTLTLSGTNTYTGTTAITEGTLALGSGGSIANSSQIIVGANTTFDVSAVSFNLGGSNAQTLSGTGSIIGNMEIDSSGTLAIGSSPGTMTFANDLGLNTGSVSNFEINAFTLGNYDLALAATAGSQKVTFNGGTLNLLFQAGFSTIGSVKIFDFDIYAGSGFTSYVTSGLAEGFTASFDATNGILTVVPEPRAAALAGLGLFALLRRRRAS